MSKPNTALASLTATYSDSDVDNEETNMDLDSASETTPNKAEASVPLPADDTKKVTKAKLVSYKVDRDEPAASDYQTETSDSEVSINNNTSDEELPSEPKGRCAPELQEKVNSLYEKVKNEGLDMNKFIQERKAFRNPSIYEKLVDFCDLNEYGTNYPPHMYDPTRWGKESFYEELQKVQKAEMDRREKERKEKTKVEIVSGTAKHVTGGNVNVTICNVPAISRSLLDASDSAKRRKTKWDQVSASNTVPINTTAIFNMQTVTTTASGTKGTIIPAFGNLPKKSK